MLKAVEHSMLYQKGETEQGYHMSEWGITCLSPTQTNQSFVSGSCIRCRTTNKVINKCLIHQVFKLYRVSGQGDIIVITL